jgi:hypothetical protein
MEPASNLERAEWAQAALRHFQSAIGADYEEALPVRVENRIVLSPSLH